MVDEATGETELFQGGDIVRSSIWMPNENGRFERWAAFPHRRKFLQRVQAHESYALLDWVDPLGSILAPGSPIDLKIRIADTCESVISCEVDSSRQERGHSAGHTTYRFTGESFLKLADLHALASGRPMTAGFRDGPRFPMDQPVRVNGGTGRARLRDLSRRGVQLSMGERVWEVGEWLRLQIRRGWFRTEELGLRVVWTTGDGRENRLGARIVDVEPSTQRWLAQRLSQWRSSPATGR